MTPDEGEPQDTTRKLIGAGVMLGCFLVTCAVIILVMLLLPRTGTVFSGMDSI